MKYIKILLVTNRRENSILTVQIETVTSLHDLEIYSYLEKMFPFMVIVNYNDENKQEGYSYEFKNGLEAVVIYRAN